MRRGLFSLRAAIAGRPARLIHPGADRPGYFAEIPVLLERLKAV